MNRKILGVVASIVLAAVGTFAVLQYANSADDRAAAGEERVEVLVVSAPVTAGEPVSSIANKVETVAVPARLRADTGVASLDELADLVAAVDLQPGEQVLTTRFKTEEEIRGEIAFLVPDNLLQVTLSLSPERAVGGQVDPGDTVAVVASFEPISPGTEPGQTGEVLQPEATGGGVGEAGDTPLTPTSHVILHKTLVTSVQIEQLPTETDLEDATENGITLAPTGNLLITLALPAPDIEKVIFSAEHGSVWLAEDPEAASVAGTAIQTRGSIYR